LNAIPASNASDSIHCITENEGVSTVPEVDEEDPADHVQGHLRDTRPRAGECHQNLDGLIQAVLRLLPEAWGHAEDARLQAAAEADETGLSA
jgi:hypothetical protein